MPPEIADKLRTMGPVFNPDVLAATRELYTPLVRAIALTDVKITRDVSYGSDERQKLDVYQPAGQAKGLPIVAYIPGGGFVGGDKNSDGLFYGNVGGYFVRQGMLTIAANYRLAPAHPWPAGPEDVGRVVAWIKANAASYGGDPERIFVLGQSAGATHAASYVFDPSLHPKEGPGVAGAILMSGLYRVTKAHTAPNLKAYFGEDETRLAERSPITHVAKSNVPLFLSLAEFDPPFLATPTLELAAAVCVRDGKCPPVVWQQGHNHVSTVFSIGTEDDEVAQKMVDFTSAIR